MGTHLRVLSEGYPMNTNTTGFSPSTLDKSSLSSGMVYLFIPTVALLKVVSGSMVVLNPIRA